MGEPKLRTVPKVKPSPEQFVTEWTKAATIDEACRALGVSVEWARTVAHRLRTKGVRLKKFPPHGARRVDVDALNRIIDGASGSRGEG